jgi:SH3-like domain-containing protein
MVDTLRPRRNNLKVELQRDFEVPASERIVPSIMKLRKVFLCSLIHMLSNPFLVKRIVQKIKRSGTEAFFHSHFGLWHSVGKVYPSHILEIGSSLGGSLMRALIPLIALICTIGAATAQTQSTLATVKVGSVKVRCGPSEQMDVCGTLEQGTEVIAHHLEGTDWYAIQPPGGSLSWISQLNVELKREPGEAAGKFPVDAVVHPLENGEAKIAAGLMGEFKPLKVQRTKLPTGTIVRVIGPRVMIDGQDSKEGWYPIVPPRDDFRYVPLAALELSSRGERVTYTVKGASETKPISVETGTISAIPSPSVTRSTIEIAGDISSNTLWRDAEQAQANSNFLRAEELYLQLATASNKAGDVKMANACYERVHAVRELGRTSKTSSRNHLRHCPRSRAQSIATRLVTVSCALCVSSIWARKCTP